MAPSPPPPPHRTASATTSKAVRVYAMGLVYYGILGVVNQLCHFYFVLRRYVAFEDPPLAVSRQPKGAEKAGWLAYARWGKGATSRLGHACT
jgi:hypothetical protein